MACKYQTQGDGEREREGERKSERGREREQYSQSASWFKVLLALCIERSVPLAMLSHIMQQTSSACMPMPPKEPPPPELMSKQLWEQLRITELKLDKANETVRRMRDTIHNLQWQVESLQAQKSECTGDGIHGHDENASGDRRLGEDVECHEERCDRKIFGNSGGGEQSGCVADPPKRTPKRKRFEVRVAPSRSARRRWSGTGRGSPEAKCEVYVGGPIPAAGSDYKRSSLTRGPAFTGHGLRICDGLS